MPRNKKEKILIDGLSFKAYNIAKVKKERCKMIKMEIHINEEKIIAEDEYEPSTIYEAVDQVFKDCKLIKGENGFYYGRNDDKEFSHFGAAISVLHNMDWFMNYVDKWLWYNSDYSDDPEDFDIEDILEFYRNKQKKEPK